jgi:hypothetical protein
MLRWALARLPLHPDERKRIEREEFEAQGFVSNIERQLVAVDQSQNGQFASRLAGLLSGSPGCFPARDGSRALCWSLSTIFPRATALGGP